MKSLSVMRRLVAAMMLLVAPLGRASDAAEPLEWVRVGDDGKTFRTADSGELVQLWGVNYDHDGDNRLIEDYWHHEWPAVEEDFAEIKALNANCVRIHLQLGRFLKTADEPDENNLAQLARLIDVAEKTELYLVITGLGCYHKQDVPAWYDALDEHERWLVQAKFWQAVAAVCKDSPAVFA